MCSPEQAEPGLSWVFLCPTGLINTGGAENSPDFEEFLEGSRVRLPKLISWSQNFTATPHKLAQCGIWLSAGKKRRGDLELPHAGFRSMSVHGELLEGGGLYELLSAFTLRHLQAQVYCSEVVKMSRKGAWARLCLQLPQMVPANLDKDSVMNVRWETLLTPSWGVARAPACTPLPTAERRHPGPALPPPLPQATGLPCHASI